jgi:hypothetical protein
MRKPNNATLALVLTTALAVLDVQAADYFPGQQIERPTKFNQRLNKAFLPGLRQSSDSPYSTNFVPENQDGYVFSDDFAKPGNVVEDRGRSFGTDRDIVDAPVSNVFKLRY